MDDISSVVRNSTSQIESMAPLDQPRSRLPKFFRFRWRAICEGRIGSGRIIVQIKLRHFSLETRTAFIL
jgi:hypothetical protein